MRSWKFAREGLFLIATLILSAGIWGFAELADEVLEGDTQDFDEKVFLALRTVDDPGDPIGPLWVEEIARDVTALGGVAILTSLTVCVSLYLFLEKRGRTGGLLVASIGGGLIISFVLKDLFDRPRPDLVPHLSHVATSSFPSGHSMLAALTYMTLFALLGHVHRRVRVKVFFFVCAIFLTVAVGLSRIYLGVHWPTDVAAGWTAGCLWALLSLIVARALPKGEQREEMVD